MRQSNLKTGGARTYSRQPERNKGMKLKITIVLLALFGALGPSFAHSGGTDASGCHYNHKTGDYHCH